jgi:DNA end-binding protein Ku
MPPRAIWTGTISFGLVNVPVRMYSAVKERDVRFNLLHEPDGSPIGYRKVCKAEDKPVPDDEIVKAFEVKKGEFVPVTDEDFAAVEAGLGGHTIEISDFVPYDDIDPISFERTYYLGPQDGSEKVYALLREAMERSGLAAIGSYVMRDKQHLGALRIRERTITLEQLYFADEIRPVDDIAPTGVRVGKRELEMATGLIDQFTAGWDHEKYRDDYRKRLLEVIRAKQKGKTLRPPEEEHEEQPEDLLAALRASIDAARRDRKATPRKPRRPARKPARTASSAKR